MFRILVRSRNNTVLVDKTGTLAFVVDYAYDYMRFVNLVIVISIVKD